VTVIRAIDVSEFTGEIPPSWWAELRRVHNVRAVIIQAWGGGNIPGRHNAHFHQQLQGALGAGMKAAAYVWPPEEWAPAIQHIWADKRRLAFLALDVEAGNGVTQAHVDGVTGADLKAVIYTNPNDWQGIMGGTLDFSHEALWLARYHWRAPPDELYALRWDITIDRAFGTYPAVGGWRRDTSKLAGWQFTGTTKFRLETLDLNLFYESAFDMENDDMAEVEELKQRLNRFMYLHHIGHAVTSLFLQCAAQADNGVPYKDWPEELRRGFRKFVDGQVLGN